MVPVDHVARVVVATAFSPLSPLGVVQITSHPRLRFEEFLSCLSLYGYNVPEVNYHEWRSSLENYVNEGGVQKDYTQHALMPLYHFVTNDLPANTKASELDDRNAVSVLKADAEWTGEDLSGGSAVTKELVGRYLKYLVITNFLEPPPEGQGEKLPDIVLTESQKEAQAHFGGRGGVM